MRWAKTSDYPSIGLSETRLHLKSRRHFGSEQSSVCQDSWLKPGETTENSEAGIALQWRQRRQFAESGA